MSAAKPMPSKLRLAHYEERNAGRMLTSAQMRRLRKKRNRAFGLETKVEQS